MSRIHNWAGFPFPPPSQRNCVQQHSVLVGVPRSYSQHTYDRTVYIPKFLPRLCLHKALFFFVSEWSDCSLVYIQYCNCRSTATMGPVKKKAYFCLEKTVAWLLSWKWRWGCYSFRGAASCRWHCVIREDFGTGGEWGWYSRAGGGIWAGADHRRTDGSASRTTAGD